MAATAAAAPRELRRSTRFGRSHAQCTHLTMVRLYSTEFRCQVCFRIPNIGWLYRCVEDRELIMAQEFEDGTLEKMDALCDVFAPMIGPKKRGPAERADNLSFFNEIDDAALKTYSPEQLRTILKQREEAVELARETSAPPSPQGSSYYNNLSSFIKGSKAPPSPGTSSAMPPHPWTPNQRTECQFKCCHFCRPHMAERSYLDLDSIVNNDIPITAAYGFGFHLSKPKGRPVMDANIVKNLGLRPNPPTREESSMFSTQDRHFAQFQASQGLGLGLGLLPVDPLPTVPTPFNAEAHILPTSTFASRYGHTGPAPSLQQFGSFADQQDITQANVPISAANPFITPSVEPVNYMSHAPNGTEPTLLERFRDASLNVRFETAVITPLPVQTSEEVEVLEFTEMEIAEMEAESFGYEPLAVVGGVAVTEEAVEMHVADFITQF